MERSPTPDEPPKTLFAKIGVALPIALSAIATAFAGLSSSEMSRAMFWRSVAAQDQAKAASQWSFAGFKRDRAMMAENTAVTLRAISGYARPKQAEETVTPGIVVRVREWMQGSETRPSDTINEQIQAVLNAIRSQAPDAHSVHLAGNIKPAALENAIYTAIQDAGEIEKAWDLEARIAKAEFQMFDGTANSQASARATAAAAVQFDVDARRYRAESTMNFWIGYLYEVRVKTSTFQSERHRIRSENFFYAMLGAQIGATIASLALARRTGNTLWLLAGIAGIIAVAFGAYVYLTL